MIPADDDLEDAEDAAIYSERKAALESGADVVLSAEVSAAILAGESLERAVRCVLQALEKPQEEP